MTTALLVLAVAAGLACPLHMLWTMRRGKRSACCPPHKHSQVDALRDRQTALATLIAASAGEATAPPRDAARV